MKQYFGNQHAQDQLKTKKCSKCPPLALMHTLANHPSNYAEFCSILFYFFEGSHSSAPFSHHVTTQLSKFHDPLPVPLSAHHLLLNPILPSTSRFPPSFGHPPAAYHQSRQSFWTHPLYVSTLRNCLNLYGLQNVSLHSHLFLISISKFILPRTSCRYPPKSISTVRTPLALSSVQYPGLCTLE